MYEMCTRSASWWKLVTHRNQPTWNFISISFPQHEKAIKVMSLLHHIDKQNFIVRNTCLESTLTARQGGALKSQVVTFTSRDLAAQCTFSSRTQTKLPEGKHRFLSLIIIHWEGDRVFSQFHKYFLRHHQTRLVSQRGGKMRVYAAHGSC